MIGACNINGFIIEACEVVERHENARRGTMDRERFETFLEQCLVPVLGIYKSHIWLLFWIIQQFTSQQEVLI